MQNLIVHYIFYYVRPLNTNNFHLTKPFLQMYNFLPAPPTLKESTLKDGSTFESLPLVYTVHASGNPKPIVRWLHNGKEVKPCNRVHISNDGDIYKIEIDRVDMKDAGEWQAEISNDLGKNVLKAQLSVSRELLIITNNDIAF